jgi:hypothetical protein
MEKLAINLSLAALAVCLADAAWIAFALSTRRSALASSSWIVSFLVGLLLLAAAASWTASDTFPWPRIDQLIVAAAAVSWLLLPLRTANQRTELRWRLNIVTHLLLMAASGCQFGALIFGGGSAMPETYVQKGVTANGAVLVTDQGRVFPMFHFDLQGRPYNDAPPFTHVTAAEVEQPTAALLPVRIADTDPRSNCHGWVFTGGRYGISELAVGALLQDNGYHQVDAPLPGDVVVYRDASGKVSHSGRVYRVHETGETWIESKWGPGGRYRHLPLDQCYSGKPEYYRSERPDRFALVVLTPSNSAEPRTLASAAATPRRPLRRVSL